MLLLQISNSWSQQATRDRCASSTCQGYVVSQLSSPRASMEWVKFKWRAATGGHAFHLGWGLSPGVTALTGLLMFSDCKQSENFPKVAEVFRRFRIWANFRRKWHTERPSAESPRWVEGWPSCTNRATGWTSTTMSRTCRTRCWICSCPRWRNDAIIVLSKEKLPRWVVINKIFVQLRHILSYLFREVRGLGLNNYCFT